MALPSDPVKGLLKEMSYQKFRIPGFNGTKQAIFLPDHLDMNSKAMKQIMKMLNYGETNLIIQMFGGSSSGEDIRQGTTSGTQSFKQLRETCTSATRDEKGVNALVNEVVHTKCRGIISAMMNAVASTGSFTCHYGPNLGFTEHLMSECKNKGLSSCNSLTAMHLQDAMPKTRLAKNLIKYLLGVAKDPKNLGISEDKVAAAETVDWKETDIWDPSHPEQTNDQFKERQSLHSYTGSNWNTDHPASNFAWPDADLFLFLYKVTGDENYSISVENKDPFDPHNVAPVGVVFAGGLGTLIPAFLVACEQAKPTVILENTGGASHCVAVAIRTVKRVLDDDLRHLRKLAHDGAKVRPGLTDSQRLQLLSPAKVLERIEKSLGDELSEYQSKKQIFSLSQIMQVLDMAKQRPQVFTETMKVVDILTEAPEETLEKLSACFSSTYTGVIELGASSAQRHVVEEAWRSHYALLRKGTRARRWSALSHYSSAVLGFLGTSLALLIHDGASCMEVSEGLQCQVLQYAEISGKRLEQYLQIGKAVIIVVPVLSGLIITLASYFQFSQSFASAHMAAALIVQHIFFYRGSVGPYSVEASEDSQGAGDGENSKAAILKNNRMRFVKNINDLVNQVMFLNDHDNLDMHETKAMMTPAQLHNHVMQSCYNSHVSSWTGAGCCKNLCNRVSKILCCCSRKKAPLHRVTSGAHLRATENEYDDDDDGVDLEEPLVSEIGSTVADGQNDEPHEEEITDWLLPFTAESYFRDRVEKLLPLYFEMGARVTTSQSRFNLMIFMCGFAASLLAAFDLSLCIPIVLAFSALLSANMHFQGLGPQDAAIKQARAALLAMKIQWSGISNIDRRTPKIKSQIVLATESLVIKVAQAKVGGRGLVENKDSDQAAESKKDDDKSQKEKSKDE